MAVLTDRPSADSKVEAKAPFHESSPELVRACLIRGHVPKDIATQMAGGYGLLRRTTGCRLQPISASTVSPLFVSRL